MKLLYLIFAIIPLAVATAAAQEKPPVTACKCARVECPPEQPNVHAGDLDVPPMRSSCPTDGAIADETSRRVEMQMRERSGQEVRRTLRHQAAGPQGNQLLAAFARNSIQR